MMDAPNVAAADDIEALARQLAASYLVPAHLRGKPTEIAKLIVTARLIGLDPLQLITTSAA